MSESSARRSWRPVALAVVSSAALAMMSGCASHQDIQARTSTRLAADLGVKEPSMREATNADPWWRRLGDAQLDALITQALEEAPSMRVAQARMARAQAQARYVSGADEPQVQLTGEVERQRYSALGLFPPPLSGHPITLGTLQLEGSWELDLFGRQRAELEAAVGQARAAEADSEAARVLLSTQLVRAYAQLGRLLAQRDVIQRLLTQREEVLALVRQRVQAGLDTAVELKQGEGALPDARVQLEAVQEQIVLARHALAALAGKGPNSLDALSPDLSALHAQSAPVQVPADLLGRRADIQAALWRVESAGHQTEAARALFYPNVNLVAFAGVNAKGLDRLFDSGSQQWGLMPAVHLPLFEGGRRRANLQGRVAEQDLAVSQYQQAVFDAVRDAADQITSVQSIERQRREQAQAQASAEAAYQLALQRYRAGLGTYLTVLSAESAVLNQRRAAVDLLARTIDTQAALVRALGGSFSGDAS